MSQRRICDDRRMEEADKILALLKQGDKRGLELLFRHFYRPLVMHALKYLPRQEEAEDVVQEVFIKFWERKRFDMIHHYLRSYLYQAVRNRCLNILESRAGITMEPEASLLEFSDTETPDDSEWNDRIEEIYREIDRLPDRTRKIFTAIVLDDKRYKEVAEELGVSVNTVKTTLSRALSTLRSNLSGGAYLVMLQLFF